MVDRLEDATVGEIVAADSRAAGVFDRFGIDFCCGGRRSLTDACRSAAADPSAVVNALGTLPPRAQGHTDVGDWRLDRIIDHIIATHHSYVRSVIPTISCHLATLRDVHGARHPELACIATVFDELGADLEQHLAKEEHVIFPYIRDLAEHAERGFGVFLSPFGTVETPLAMLEREHREAADEMRVIRELTDGYAVPADGCATYAACMSELEEFEHDLHQHVHLENNVLFPKAVALEHAPRLPNGR
ncbi:MAG: iron-sulfur cluster repair di-iron protein [Acidobacteria bacterium RIFCSPLOWO2_02_FULL_65_29]|nr:MAG: iron-sulfur cluster repair di-iron protein [Acidobacteria bacterium RIFCSPLOWO2_02_FULL_65_29]